LPMHGIRGVLEQVRARFFVQSVAHEEHYR
jgi:hypothetical protein